MVSTRAHRTLVQVSQVFGNLQKAVYGAVPLDEAPAQMARDGEDWALFKAVSFARGDFDIYVDCKATYDLAAVGNQAGTESSQARAHIWTRIWCCVDSIRVHKTMAHATQADVDSGKTTFLEKEGMITPTVSRSSARSSTT